MQDYLMAILPGLAHRKMPRSPRSRQLNGPPAMIGAQAVSYGEYPQGMPKYYVVVTEKVGRVVTTHHCFPLPCLSRALKSSINLNLAQAGPRSCSGSFYSEKGNKYQTH